MSRRDIRPWDDRETVIDDLPVDQAVQEAAADMAISLEGIWYRYPGSPRWILRDLSLGFREGEVAVLLGPNGSGKTTLLKISSLIYEPARGVVKAWGMDFWRLGEVDKIRLRRRLVYVHENPILIRGTALHNVAYGLLLRKVDKDEAFKRAGQLLEELGVHYLRDKPAGMLSAGEAQLVSILRAVAVDPSLIFLDEPLAHLDLKRRGILLSIIDGMIDRGAGVVIATHDLSLAESIADRIILLEDGAITWEGGRDTVSEHSGRKA